MLTLMICTGMTLSLALHTPAEAQAGRAIIPQLQDEFAGAARRRKRTQLNS